MSGDAGIAVTTLVDWVGIVVGLVSTITVLTQPNKSTSDILSATGTLAQFVPVAGRFAVDSSFVAETEYTSATILFVIDIVCDIASGALTCASDFT
jgi:hypothetical protein